MLPHLRNRFLSAQCVEHPQLGTLFSDSAEFLRATRLRKLDLELLARELRMPPAPPTKEWLHAFWETVAKHATHADAGIGVRCIPQLVSHFRGLNVLPVWRGDPAPVSSLAQTLALPSELVRAPLSDTGRERWWDEDERQWVEDGAGPSSVEGAGGGAGGDAALGSVLSLLEDLQMPMLQPEFVRRKKQREFVLLDEYATGSGVPCSHPAASRPIPPHHIP